MISLKSHSEQLNYLIECSSGDDPVISKETALKSWMALSQFWVTSNFKMKLFCSCSGPDGQMFHDWDNERYHLELEIFPDKPAEFFFKDRRDGGISFLLDWNVSDPIPDRVLEKMPLFYEKEEEKTLPSKEEIREASSKIHKRFVLDASDALRSWVQSVGIRDEGIVVFMRYKPFGSQKDECLKLAGDVPVEFVFMGEVRVGSPLD